MCDKKGINISNFRKLIDKTTREKVAKALDCDTSLVTKHYNGDRSITLDYAIKYADYFDVSLDYLVGRSNVESSDKDIQYIGDYTGLKIETINILHEINTDPYNQNYHYLVDFINSFLSSACYTDIQYLLYYFDSHQENAFYSAKNYLHNVNLNDYYNSLENNATIGHYMRLFTDLSAFFGNETETLSFHRYLILKDLEKFLDNFLERYEHPLKDIHDKLTYFLKNKRNLKIEDIAAIQSTLKDIVKLVEQECSRYGND